MSIVSYLQLHRRGKEDREERKEDTGGGMKTEKKEGRIQEGEGSCPWSEFC